MIIVDFNQVVISNLAVSFNKEMEHPDNTTNGLIKHMILSTLLSYKQKYGKEFGQILIATDNRKYWRRDKFSYYKGKRKQAREESKWDWNFIFKVLDEIKADLKEHFPYKLLDVPGAEADDVIACLAKHLQDNELTQQGLMTDPQPIMIVSSDTDFMQLQKYPNVKQWSPMQKKMVKPKTTLQEFVVDHICTGDVGDGIPNICSPDNCIVDGIRQTSFMKKRFEDFINKGIDACKDETERRNYQRNQMLIDFEFIPQDIHDAVIDEYKTQVVKGNKTKVFNYFIKNKMKLLLEHAGDF